jgi:hypothetical protein
MIVIDGKVTRAAGIDFPTAIALMEPAEGELVVCIRRETLGPDDPVSSLVVAEPEATERLHADELGGHGVRRTHRASVPYDDELPTIAPTQRQAVSTPGRRQALPMTAEEVDAHRLAAWTMTDAQRLGPGDTHG